jgi:selenide,water dikinase
VGLEHADDAGVFRISDELALVQTLDFFTPIVDDPYTFGLIAAANALSDVYAMGGRPLTAMNIVAFPIDTMDISVLTEILAGGLAKLQEASVALVGGHSVTDNELKYGMSVTGVVHPDRVLTNRGARPGDALVLTKPLGTGIVNTAIKAELADPAIVDRVVASMAALNRAAAEVAAGFPISACTDVTGFGLLGHGCEMIAGSGTGLRIATAALPVFPGVAGFADMGLLPAGLHRNREFRARNLEVAPGVARHLVDVVCDPQTSGGLLLALDGAQADRLVAALRDAGIRAASRVAEVVDDPAERVVLLP